MQFTCDIMKLHSNYMTSRENKEEALRNASELEPRFHNTSGENMLLNKKRRGEKDKALNREAFYIPCGVYNRDGHLFINKSLC